MSPTRRLRLALLWVAVLTGLGTVGYVAIVGLSPLDALYMTVITLSTVGYREIGSMGPGGQIFTMALIATGVGSVLYLVTAVAETVVEGHLRDLWGKAAMQRRIEALDDHVIICGYGRFGRAVADELRRQAAPIVVIDHDAALEPELRELGAPFLIGSALSDEVLERAGIRRARAIVIGTASDSDNVFIALSAREKNPRLRIHARGESDAGLRRLRLAGADQAISAYSTGGMRVAASILRPSVVDFLEISAPGRGEAIDLEEVRVDAGCPVTGCTIAAVEREFPRLRVVALKCGEEPIRLIPEAETPIGGGDYLVVIGDRSSLERLAQRCGPATGR